MRRRELLAADWRGLFHVIYHHEQLCHNQTFHFYLSKHAVCLPCCHRVLRKNAATRDLQNADYVSADYHEILAGSLVNHHVYGFVWG